MDNWQPTPETARLAVRQKGGGPPQLVDIGSIVRAQPIEGGDLVDRLDGYVSGGLDYAKASSQRSFDLSGGLSGRTKVHEWSIDASANLTDDSAGKTSERYQLDGDWRWLREPRSFWQGFGGISHNSELELDLRTLVGAGYGRYFVQNNFADWSGMVGVAYTNEQYTGGEETDNLEGVLMTSFSIFRYDFPETDIGGTLTLLPSLTTSGRYRAEVDLRAKYEFVDDLYFEMKVYGSYDSEPPNEDAEKSDYGLITSLGYSF
jgi:hypothetical protein